MAVNGTQFLQLSRTYLRVLSCPGLSEVPQLLGLQVARTFFVFPDLGTLKWARQALCRPSIRLGLSGF